MRPMTKTERITDKIAQLKPEKGQYFVFSAHLMLMDYSVRLSYRGYLQAIDAIQKHELDGTSFDASRASLKVLSNARFFFESVYGFVYMFQRLSKDKSNEPFVLLLNELFKKYATLKLPRVKISKDHFNKLIWAEGTGNQEVIKELTGDSKFLYNFSSDMSGLIKFQGEAYDPHDYFRSYVSLLTDLEKGLDKILKTKN